MYKGKRRARHAAAEANVRSTGRRRARMRTEEEIASIFKEMGVKPNESTIVTRLRLDRIDGIKNDRKFVTITANKSEIAEEKKNA
jgi:hypothetical protein